MCNQCQADKVTSKGYIYTLLLCLSQKCINQHSQSKYNFTFEN